MAILDILKQKLKGKKTYLSAGLLFVLGGLRYTGYVDQDQFDTTIAILASLGLIASRVGSVKVEVPKANA